MFFQKKKLLDKDKNFGVAVGGGVIDFWTEMFNRYQETKNA